MICRMCLKEFNNLINIFNNADGELKMSDIVGKHFWFKPTKDDTISTVICKNCWLRVYDFHEYYKMVKKAQTVLQENSSVLYNCESLSETREVPFQIISGNVLSDNLSFDNHVHTNSSCNDMEDEDEKEGNKNKPFSKKNESESFSTKDVSRKLIGRKCVQSKLDNKTVYKSNCKTQNNLGGNKRGRPKKTNGVIKLRKTPDRQVAYKAKIKEYDEEIAKYMPLYCNICNGKSENFPALRVHMRDTHNVEGYITCCDKKFNKRALLLYHIRQHLNPNCYRCEECDFTFSDRQSRHNHFLVKHQKDEDKIYACSKCSKKFVRKYLLEQHKSFSHRDSIPKCKNCGKRFKTVEELTEHNKEDCYIGTMCDICAKCIRGIAAFKRHQLEHNGVILPKVQCELCGLWYKDKRGLKRHKIKHVEPTEAHVCDICQKISPSRSAMLSHKRYAHGTDRVHKCAICQKTFKKPISLREHMTTHTGEVLYNCPHCPKTFNSNANMHSHRKKIHPKEFQETRNQRKQNVNIGEQTIF